MSFVSAVWWNPFSWGKEITGEAIIEDSEMEMLISEYDFDGDNIFSDKIGDNDLSCKYCGVSASGKVGLGVLFDGDDSFYVNGVEGIGESFKISGWVKTDQSQVKKIFGYVIDTDNFWVVSLIDRNRIRLSVKVDGEMLHVGATGVDYSDDVWNVEEH